MTWEIPVHVIHVRGVRVNELGMGEMCTVNLNCRKDGSVYWSIVKPDNTANAICDPA